MTVVYGDKADEGLGISKLSSDWEECLKGISQLLGALVPH